MKLAGGTISVITEFSSRFCKLKILVYVNQAILNFIIWSESTQDFLTRNFSNTDLFDVILDKRNEVLSSTIIESEHNNIYHSRCLAQLHPIFKWNAEGNCDSHLFHASRVGQVT